MGGQMKRMTGQPNRFAEGGGVVRIYFFAGLTSTRRAAKERNLGQNPV